MVAVRSRIDISVLPAFLESSIVKIEEYLASRGEVPSEVPYVAIKSFRTLDPENTDIEIGVLVTSEMPDKSGIVNIIREERSVLSCFYQGPNEEMQPVYDELLEWAAFNSMDIGGDAEEYYYSGPDMDPVKMITRIMLPLKRNN